MEKWRLLSSTALVTNQWITVRRDECETARGATAEYYVVEKRDFAMVVPIDRRGQVLLVRQYKHPVGGIVVECPAGYVERGEEPEAAAIRELREETGFQPGELKLLAIRHASPAVLTNRAFLYLCTGVQPAGAQRLDRTEDIEIVRMDFEDVVGLVVRGALISDMASTAAILLASQALKAT